LKDYGVQLRLFNVNLVLRFREVLIVGNEVEIDATVLDQIHYDFVYASICMFP